MSTSDGGGTTNQVDAAKALAIEAHHGQRDKAGKPYIEHPARVAARVAGDPDAECVAWLHDVVEDTPVTLEDLSAKFDPAIVDAVRVLTRQKFGRSATGDLDVDYYIGVRANPLAKKVKLADIDDNADPVRLALLDPALRERLEAKYARAHMALDGTDYVIVEDDDKKLCRWRIDAVTGSLCFDAWSANGEVDWGHSVKYQDIPRVLDALGVTTRAELYSAIAAGLDISTEWLDEREIPFQRFRWP